MKKVIVIFAVLVVLAVSAFVLSTYSGCRVSNKIDLSDPDKKAVEQLTLRFLEDIKFKDFKKAGTYHNAEEMKKVNIPMLLERIFQIKPEFLDIMRYEITGIDLDSSKIRARVKTHLVIKVLNTKEIKEVDVIFFYHKEEGKWYMKLESSLR